MSSSIITLILPFIFMAIVITGIIVLIVVLVNKSNKKSNAQYQTAYQTEAMQKQRLIHLLHTQKNVPLETITMLSAMSFAEVYHFASQNQLIDQQIIQEMSNPYPNQMNNDNHIA